MRIKNLLYQTSKKNKEVGLPDLFDECLLYFNKHLEINIKTTIIGN